MKLSRVAQAFPWRIAFLLTLAICLPVLTSWGWLTRELPPLQRYYLRAYWESSETANEPAAKVQVRWLEVAARGRKNEWPINSWVTDDPSGDSPALLSSRGRAQGWTGIEESPPYLIRSTELEGILRRAFYDGRSFGQVVSEPALYGGFAVLVVLFLAWMMRDDIGSESRAVRRAIRKLESEWESGWNIPPYRQTIGARIRNRITQALATVNDRRKRFRFPLITTHGSAPHSVVDSQPAAGYTRPSFSADDPERSVVPNISNPGSAAQANAELIRHLVFPGSSQFYVASKDADAWHESEWIE